MCPSVCLEIPCNVLSSNENVLGSFQLFIFVWRRVELLFVLKKKKKRRKKRQKTTMQAGRLMKMKKEACTFIVNILRSHSSNLRLVISWLLRGSLGRISVSQFLKWCSSLGRVWSREGTLDFRLMSILKAQTHWFSTLLLYIVEMGEKGEASLGYFISILEALIINTESEKVQIYFIGLS